MHLHQTGKGANKQRAKCVVQSGKCSKECERVNFRRSASGSCVCRHREERMEDMGEERNGGGAETRGRRWGGGKDPRIACIGRPRL